MSLYSESCVLVLPMSIGSQKPGVPLQTNSEFNLTIYDLIVDRNLFQSELTGSKLGVTYTDKGERHEVGSLNKFGHLTFWVGNAKQAAEWYCTKFGFQPYFYKGKIL